MKKLILLGIASLSISGAFANDADSELEMFWLRMEIAEQTEAINRQTEVIERQAERQERLERDIAAFGDNAVSRLISK